MDRCHCYANTRMLINLRGTNGSGKSTAVVDLMNTFSRDKFLLHDTVVYKVKATRPLYVLGKYETACGGCDTIKTVQQVIDLATELAEQGDVLFEGILISTTYGAVGQWSERYGDDFAFAFMTTPVEECVRRVEARRKAVNNPRPFDSTGLRAKFATIERLRQRLIAENRRVVAVRDYVDLMGLLL